MPDRGVLVTSDVDRLREGDIIVAIRGYRVESEAEYGLIRETEPFGEFDLVLFRAGKYLTFGPFRARRRFGNLQDYSRP